MIMQLIYDKRLFHNYANADEVVKDFWFGTRRRGGLEESKGRYCNSMILFKNTN